MKRFKAKDCLNAFIKNYAFDVYFVLDIITNSSQD